MRVFSFLALGATLASAAPLSVVVTSTEVNAWRVGHPALGMGRIAMVNPPPSRMRHLCHKMQASVSRIFAFAGLGPALPDPATFAAVASHNAPHHAVHPSDMAPLPIWQKAGLERLAHGQHHHEHVGAEDGAAIVGRPYHRHHFHPHHGRHGTFLHRVHRALMSLGPWEGRTVAFVLGCGIGVLLRMFWVMTVLLFRAIRGSSNEQDEDLASYEYEQVPIVVSHPEEIFIAPPEYTDEKIDTVDAGAKA